MSEEFPNLVADLTARGLRPEHAEKLSNYLKWLRVLPYANRQNGRDLLVFYYTEFQAIKRSLAEKPREKKLCSLFQVLARMMFQGSSVFPASSARLAVRLMNCLKKYPANAGDFRILADLLTGREGRFLHGFNTDELNREQVNCLVTSEHWHRAADFEHFYKSKGKFDTYRTRVMESPQFRKDWNILKRKFPEILESGKRVLRPGQREKGSADLIQAARWDPAFQDAFDFFCWKWFLDGMEGDQPVVTKLSFAVTPFGTTIFIPGYWSFDPKRDIKWHELIAFHRSRGVKRQGEAFDPTRLERERKERVLLEAERIGRELGERGKALIQRCIQIAKLSKDTDPAYIYRVLREAKRKQERRLSTEG